MLDIVKMTESWTVIKQAADENRHELVLSGPNISKLIADDGLDMNLFNLQNINYLHVTHTCLQEVPEEIQNLKNLTTLVLHSNEITKIPNAIDNLPKLKVLDLSRNKLSDLPNGMSNLPQLTTINFGSNLLKSIPSQIANVNLSILDLSNNKLDKFPDVCYQTLVHLSEIYVNGNQIKEIPASIHVLQSLKILNIASNSISVVPAELADCNKLKEVNLKGNKLADKRLLKLVDQCRTKQVLEYVRLHCTRSIQNANVGKKTQKGKKGQKSTDNDISSEIDNMTHKIKVLKMTDQTPLIKITKNVKEVRPYIAACIVKNLSFNEDSFKKFIQLQTRLHDGICEKRNAATIATHDLKLIAPGNLTYTAQPPNELEIKPLMRNKIYTGATLFQQLQQEADNLRKEKKRNAYSGIHKYLYLLEGKPQYPCLLDSMDQVISFPPITNSDNTKISVDTETVLIEVTSSTSYQICGQVLDCLLKELIMSGLGCSPTNANESECRNLTVEQVRIVDVDGNLKLIYPSRSHLNFVDDNVSVLRE